MKVLNSGYIIFTALILVVQGCSSSKQADEASSQPPTIENASAISWDENTPFEHKISASGKGSLNFRLLQSPDSQSFRIDESTGVLSSDNGFNFEYPEDSDSNNQYEVSIIVSDAESRTTTLDLMVSINDLIEHTTEILFPIEGSNVGGIAKSIHVRGRIQESGVSVTSIPEGMVAMVNGVVAEISDTRADEWIAEVPLVIGPNTFTIDLINGGAPESTTILNISNTPVKIPRSALSSGNDLTYYLSPASQAIIQANSVSGETETLISIASPTIASTCYDFGSVILNKSGDKLAISCQKQKLGYLQEQESSLFIYDTKSSTLNELSGVRNITRDSRWLDDRYLITRYNYDSIAVLDTTSFVEKSIDVSHENPDETLDYKFTNDGYRIYVSSRINNLEGSSYFDLGSVIGPDTPEDEVIAYTTESNTPLASQPTIANGHQYTIFGSRIEKVDMQTGETTTLTLSNSVLWPELEGAYVTIIHVTNEFLVLRNNASGLLVRYNLESGQLIALNSESIISNETILISETADVSLKPDNGELAVYDISNHKFVTVDLNTYATTAVHDFSDIIDTTQFTFGRISYDWEQQVIYRHRVLDWSGIAPSEDAHIVATDIKNHSHTTIISGFDIDSIVGTGSKYRMGDVKRTDKPNEVWFAVKVYNPLTEDMTIQLPEPTHVFSYNTQTTQSQLLYTLEAPVDGYYFIGYNEPFISDYSSKYNGVALTAWLNGYLATLSDDGSTQEYVSPFDPYIISLHSIIDESNSRIFMAGYFPLDPYADPVIERYVEYDADSLEVSEVDLNTGQVKAIASREEGNGLPFSGAAFRYDASRDLLMDFSYGHIFIIDPNSGDRVLKSLVVPLAKGGVLSLK